MRDDFDKKMDALWRLNIAMMIMGSLIGLGFLGFIVWIIIMVMRYFGIV